SDRRPATRERALPRTLAKPLRLEQYVDAGGTAFSTPAAKRLSFFFLRRPVFRRHPAPFLESRSFPFR
ncbi:MAG: hypothetical protein AAF191_04320, partial [Verrucomicrobiota bacterium]